MIEATIDTELSELTDLVKSPGYQRYLRHVRAEWRDRYPERLKQAVVEAKANGEDLQGAIEKVDYANDQINLLLSWPEERISALQQVKNTANVGGRFFGKRRA